MSSLKLVAIFSAMSLQWNCTKNI